jgi:hypothetical protein
MKPLCRYSYLLPPILLGIFQCYCALDFPMLDQWEIVPLLQTAEDGISLRELFSQHNEHRPLLPRIIMLLSAWLTDWDVRVENYLALLCGVLIYAMLHPALPARPWQATLLLSALVFSAVQWQNWLLGWQLQLMLGHALAIAAMLLLTAARPTTPAMPAIIRLQLPAALLCAVASTFSFATGLVLWPIGLLLLLGQRRPAAAGAWALAGVAVVTAYFWDFHQPPHHAPPSPGAEHLGYFLAYLGSPVAPYHALAAAMAGAAGLVALAAMLLAPDPARDAKQHFHFGLHALNRLSAPGQSAWCALALFALGSAAITAYGRGHEGMQQASAAATPPWDSCCG